MVTLRVRSMVWFATSVVLAVFATLLVAQEWRADAAPGDTDSTFVPVAPCRLFDMRPGAVPAGGKKTPLASGESNVYIQQVTGSVGNCGGIPPEATAVSMNVTIVSPTAQSNLRLYPADVSTPTVSNLNWLPGQSPTPNKVDVKLSDGGKIKMYNHAGTVNVLADVVGYYTAKSLKELAAAKPVTLGQGVDWESNGNNASIVSVFENGTGIDGDTGGTAHLSLIGPVLLGAADYQLTSINYCVLVEAQGGTVDEASIIGLTPSGNALETRDETVRDANGCYTITADTDVATADVHQLMFFVVGEVLITQVTATWTPT